MVTEEEEEEEEVVVVVVVEECCALCVFMCYVRACARLFRIVHARGAIPNQ